MNVNEPVCPICTVIPLQLGEQECYVCRCIEPKEKVFYRVAETVAKEDTDCCTCQNCTYWTIVYKDPHGELTEIGSSWRGPEGRESALDICDLMNMAFDAGREIVA